MNKLILTRSRQSKLANLKFSVSTLEWFQSYLVNPQQRVAIGGDKSSCVNVKTGVPQGSVLGPLRFSLYMNDLAEACAGAGFQTYTDDAVVYVAGKDVTSVSSQLSCYLDSISAWFEKSCLTLNVKKLFQFVYLRGLSL